MQLTWAIVGIMPTMAYAVQRGHGRWELRESRQTPKGPRARTLASFRTLTPDVAEHALARAEGRVSAADLRRAATRAGAPVSLSAAEDAGATLLAELSAGRGPSAATRRLLADALGSADRAPSDAERAAAPWIGVSARERGLALRDLLLLADRLPAPARGAAVSFPGIPGRPA